MSRGVLWVALTVAVLAAIGGAVWNNNKESSLGWFLGGASTTMEHRDESRGAVGWTAFLVCLLRAVESSSADPIFQDAVAERLFSLNEGQAPLSARLALKVLQTLPILKRIPRLQRVQAIVSLRTHFLDVQIKEALSRKIRNGQEQQQMVIMGAGLDGRAFCLASVIQETGTTLFEMDLPGMLAEKRRLFAANGFLYDDAPYILVGADLSDAGWDAKLMKQGFDKSLRTVWLLEGFTAYLTEQELETLLATLRQLSAPSSRILATWIATPNNHLPTLSMHQSFIADPTALLAPFGFTVQVQVQPLSVASKLARRFEDSAAQEYILTSHEKPINDFVGT